MAAPPRSSGSQPSAGPAAVGVPPRRWKTCMLPSAQLSGRTAGSSFRRYSTSRCVASPHVHMLKGVVLLSVGWSDRVSGFQLLGQLRAQLLQSCQGPWCGACNVAGFSMMQAAASVVCAGAASCCIDMVVQRCTACHQCPCSSRRTACVIHDQSQVQLHISPQVLLICCRKSSMHDLRLAAVATQQLCLGSARAHYAVTLRASSCCAAAELHLSLKPMSTHPSCNVLPGPISELLCATMPQDLNSPA